MIMPPSQSSPDFDESRFHMLRTANYFHPSFLRIKQIFTPLYRVKTSNTRHRAILSKNNNLQWPVHPQLRPAMKQYHCLRAAAIVYHQVCDNSKLPNSILQIIGRSPEVLWTNESCPQCHEPTTKYSRRGETIFCRKRRWTTECPIKRYWLLVAKDIKAKRYGSNVPLQLWQWINISMLLTLALVNVASNVTAASHAGHCRCMDCPIGHTNNKYK